MKRWIACVAACAAAALVAAGVEDDGRARVEVVGLQVVKPLRGDERKQSFTGRKVGAALTLKVARADKHFLGVDRKQCRLEAFVDDRGTKMVGDAAKLLRTWLDGKTWVSGDGRSCLFEVLSMRPPARGAKKLTFRANMVFQCGRGELTAEQPDFALRKDSRLTVGPAAMKVTGIHRGEGTIIFALSTKTKTDRIARIEFVGADGKCVPGELVDQSVVGFMGNTFYERTYRLKSKAPLNTVTARVVYFRSIEPLEVPVDVTAGLGL